MNSHMDFTGMEEDAFAFSLSARHDQLEEEHWVRVSTIVRFIRAQASLEVDTGARTVLECLADEFERADNEARLGPKPLRIVLTRWLARRLLKIPARPSALQGDPHRNV